MIKIGHVTYRYKPTIGGAETYLASLFDILEHAGYKQFVFQADTGIESSELRIVPRGTTLLPKLVGFNLGLRRYRRELSEMDVLIVHYPEHYFPVVWHPAVIVLSHGATWTHESNPIRRALRKMAAMYAFAKAKIFVANDTFVLRELGLDISPGERLFQKVGERAWFVPNCVDTTVFDKQSEPEHSKPEFILVPRNLTYSRGIDLAIEAFGLIHETWPEQKLLIIGDVLEDNAASVKYKADLVNMCQRLNIESSVVFAGRIPWSEMPGIYQKASMTLIPTRFSEGTSLSALESMASGVPTIGTKVEGLLDLPVFHCDPEPQSMSQAMKHVLMHGREIALQQQQIVRNKYNLRNWGRTWVDLVELATR